jgi:hypothetical protein
MPLYVVSHDHDPERCPAADPVAGAALLKHLNRRSDGIKIRGEAVVHRHAMVAIVEASDEQHLQAFVKPFAAAGRVEVLPASTCAGVIARGGCAAPTVRLDGGCRRSIPRKPARTRSMRGSSSTGRTR